MTKHIHIHFHRRVADRKTKDSYTTAEKDEYYKIEAEHSDLAQKREDLSDKGRSLNAAQVERMKVLEKRMKELHAKMNKVGDAGEFKEGDHPREENGQFGSGGGSSGGGSSGGGKTGRSLSEKFVNETFARAERITPKHSAQHVVNTMRELRSVIKYGTEEGYGDEVISKANKLLQGLIKKP